MRGSDRQRSSPRAQEPLGCPQSPVGSRVPPLLGLVDPQPFHLAVQGTAADAEASRRLRAIAAALPERPQDAPTLGGRDPVAETQRVFRGAGGEPFIRLCEQAIGFFRRAASSARGLGRPDLYSHGPWRCKRRSDAPWCERPPRRVMPRACAPRCPRTAQWPATAGGGVVVRCPAAALTPLRPAGGAATTRRTCGATDRPP